jgi:hypothetical protein
MYSEAATKLRNAPSVVVLDALHKTANSFVLVLLVWFNVNSTWLIVGGALTGLLNAAFQ